MSAILEPLRQDVSVGMGQIAFVSGGSVARSILGSCIGLSLYESMRKLGALAHVVLPASEGRSGSAGKFVDTALAAMLAHFRAEGVDVRTLKAKLTGGSNMFAASGPFRIGEQNVEAARKALAKAGIRISAEDLGGNAGRRVTFHAQTGIVDVEIAGCSPIKL